MTKGGSLPSRPASAPDCAAASVSTTKKAEKHASWAARAYPVVRAARGDEGRADLGHGQRHGRGEEEAAQKAVHLATRMRGHGKVSAARRSNARAAHAPQWLARRTACLRRGGVSASHAKRQLAAAGWGARMRFGARVERNARHEPGAAAAPPWQRTQLEDAGGQQRLHAPQRGADGACGAAEQRAPHVASASHRKDTCRPKAPRGTAAHPGKSCRASAPACTCASGRASR